MWHSLYSESKTCHCFENTGVQTQEHTSISSTLCLILHIMSNLAHLGILRNLLRTVTLQYVRGAKGLRRYVGVGF